MSSFVVKLKKRIPRLSIQAMNLHIGHRLFLIFCFGVIAGTLILNIFLGKYAGKLGVYSEYFINGVNIYEGGIDKGSFFGYCIKKYLGECLVILFFNITPVGRIFDYIYCCYKGLALSLLISSATLTYGAGGIVLYIISIFPHYLLYVPFIIATMYIAIQVAEMFKEKKKGRFKLRTLIVLLVLIFGTAFLEAYTNYPILQMAFT